MTEPDPLMLLDAEGVVVEWSREAERLLGRTAEQAVGRPAASLIPPEGRAAEGLRLELRPMAAADGAAADGAAAWAVSARTEASAAQWAINSAVLEALFTQSPLGLHVLDPELRVLRFNANASGARDVDPQDVVGRHISDVYPACDHGQVEPLLRKVLSTGVKLQDHLLHCCPPSRSGREHIFSVSAFRLTDPDGQLLGIAVSVTDVTEREHTRARLSLLHDARMSIGTTLDTMKTAVELTEVAVPRFADAAAVDLLDSVVRGADPPLGPVDPDVPVRRAAFRSLHSELGAFPVGAVSGFPFPTPFTQSLTDLEPRVVRDLETEGREWLANDPQRAARLRSVGAHSLIVVPLVVRGAVLGLVSFYRTNHPDAFDDDDLTVAVDLAARTALCVDNARRFTREHTVAVTLQRHLVRSTPPRQDAADIARYYLPAGAGGDWFDVIPLSGARVALVVGDVSGRGLRTAATMARLRTAIDALAVLDLEPDELLARLDDTALRIAEESADWPTPAAASAESLRATCLYVVYDPLSRRCTAASAGHPSPLITHPDGTVEQLEVPTGPPLGEGDLPFDACDLRLAEGSLLTLFSQGMLCGTAEPEDGLRRLREAVTRPERPLKDICDTAVYTLLPARPREDAVLLLARTRVLGPDRVATWELPCDPSSAATARCRVREQLIAWGLADELFSAELIASELITNAVRYGAAPIHLRLIRDQALTCEVFDSGGNAPRLRHARANDEGGRGLFIVARMAQSWGTRYTGSGKVIWARQAITHTEG
ncbi:SpoIIE family protein phosphatase [Peterkaempfera sp. SMS 1(5)a]|uniref:SpoIIE family protein phosphatase n=1 Tax=Peterkaempfera podocarpi TaxID=3232308 RepID=UPI00366BF197